MKSIDDRDSPRPDTATEERLAADLASLRPAPAGNDLRARIAAELAGMPSAGRPARASGLWRGAAERLAWAAVGAVAASLVLLLSRGKTVPEQPAVVPEPVAVAVNIAEPAADPGQPLHPLRVSEHPVAWSDEGIRFLDGVTPARILRRRVVERHLAEDGRAEVRVPREDVIFLPVALR